MTGRLSYLRLFAYGFPAFPLAALTLPVTIFLPTYYAQEIGLGLALTGFILFISKFWDVVTDPLIGYFSDKTQSKYGRRKIWVLAGMPLTMLASWFLLSPPDDAGAGYLLIWSILLCTGWTAMILPLMALGAELSDDYHERSRISGAREALIVAGLLCSLSLTAVIDAQALKVLAYFIILVLPVATFVFFGFIKESVAQSQTTISLKKGLKILGKNKPFRHLLIAYLVNGLANGFPAILFLIFAEYGLGMKDQAGPLLFIYFLFGLLAVPFWLWLSKKFGKHKTWCYAMIWACLFFLLVPFVGQGDYWLFFTVCVLTGLSLGADLTLPASMQADVVDIDRLETGEQRTGIYFALWSMATKLSLAIAAGIAFPILEISGFSDGQAGNIWVLVALYALVPIVLKGVAIRLMWSHPLDEAELQNTQKKIMDRWG